MASRLFSSPHPGPLGQDVSYVQLDHVPARSLHKKPMIPADVRPTRWGSWGVWIGPSGLSRRCELRIDGVLRRWLWGHFHGLRSTRRIEPRGPRVARARGLL